MEKKKTYQKATMKVVGVETETHLLSASGANVVEARMNHTWTEKDI